MENKEALEKLKSLYKSYFDKIGLNEKDVLGFDLCFNTIEKDLDRLEKYEKAKEFIKKKKVDVTEILYISKKYVKELWALVYNKHHPNELTQEQSDFILEVFR